MALVVFLIKSGSVLLVIPIILVAVVRIFKKNENGERLSIVKALPRILLMVAPAAVVAASWKILLRINRVERGFAGDYSNFQSYRMTAKPFIEYLTSGAIRTIPSWLFESFCPVRDTPLAGMQSFLFFAALLLILGMSLLVATSSKYQSARVDALYSAVVIAILQILGIFVLVAVAFGGVFLSVPRYASLALGCMGSTIVLTFFSEGIEWNLQKSLKNIVALVLAGVSIVCLLLLFPSRDGVPNKDAWFWQAGFASRELSTQARGSG